MKKTVLFLTLLFFVFFTVGIAQTTQEGLVGYWKFDEGTGTAVSDELGTTNGELVNSVEATWTTGYMGGALDFSQTDGNPAYARFDGDGAANIDGSLSICMWVKADLTVDHEQSVISKGVPYLSTGDKDGGWYHLSLKNSKIRFMIWDESTLSSPEGDLPSDLTWDSNTWYFIAAVRDVATTELNAYLNGELISTATDELMESIANNEDLTFGSVAHGVNNSAPDGTNFWDSNFLGSLDEVQLYNVALTSTQIKAIYDAYLTVGVDSKQVEKLQISLNASGNELVLYNAERLSKVEVFSLTGQLVKTANTSMAPRVSLDVSDLSRGTYIVKAYGLDYSVAASKFVKQ